MRISTNMIYDMGSSKISDLQAAMLKTQQQISTNRRVLTPADDPIASASAIGINQAISMNEQFTTNRQNAKGALAQEESVLQSMTMLLQSVKDAVVGAGNASMNDEQRRMYLAQLNSSYDELLGQIHTTLIITHGGIPCSHDCTFDRLQQLSHALQDAIFLRQRTLGILAIGSKLLIHRDRLIDADGGCRSNRIIGRRQYTTIG